MEKEIFSEESEVMALYDIRGIQDYVFRNAEIKDVIGASAIVENVITEALADSVKRMQESDAGRKYLSEKSFIELEWCGRDGVKKYTECKEDSTEPFIQVLYIGGGNACVLFGSYQLAVMISKMMAKYVIDKTYSLQLAVAYVKKGDNYLEDYKSLNENMVMVKENMKVSKPLGALPVMKVEAKTGYPIVEKNDHKINDSIITQYFSTETRQKKSKEKIFRGKTEHASKVLDNYVTQKEKDSMLAIVHIDGNNMGNRIRLLLEKETEYEKAVNKMREISYNISSSYRTVFDEMERFFNMQKTQREDQYFVMKVLAAGDDITYVCNATIALASVEYYCNRISRYSMLGNTENKNDENNPYRFSVCAGIAYIGSHFPFSVGYEVAEECCASAKKRANSFSVNVKDNSQEKMVGNWVDFQICKNVKALDFKEMRRREYITRSGELLLRRPYFIYTGEKETMFQDINKKSFSYDAFKDDYELFRHIPHSFLKDIRNTYPKGESSIRIFNSFLKSRNNQIADDEKMYYEDSGLYSGKIARFYDNLEIMDYFMYIESDSNTGNMILRSYKKEEDCNEKEISDEDTIAE